MADVREPSPSDPLTPNGAARQKKKSHWTDYVGIFFFVLFMSAGSIAVSLPSLRKPTLDLLDWFRHHPVYGVPIYVGFFSIGASLCFPEVVLAIGSGYAFPFGWAVLATWLGGVIGAAIAFLVGRYCVRGFLQRLCWTRFAIMREIDRAVARLGWKLVLLIRLPYVPFVQMNYVLACTGVSLRDYVFATAVGIIPGSALYVYIGKGIKDVSQADHKDKTQTIMTICGIVVSICAFVGLTIYARKKVKEAAAAHAAAASGVEATQLLPDDPAGPQTAAAKDGDDGDHDVMDGAGHGATSRV